MSKLIYEIDGNTGNLLQVYEDKCVISIKKGMMNFLNSGGKLNGAKEFYFSDVTGVQFRNATMFTNGFLQFDYPGAQDRDPFHSENSFVFGGMPGSAGFKRVQQEMPQIVAAIKEKIAEARQTKSQPVQAALSPAEELRKFKELLDMGIVTQEEFDAKKKQLLGL